MKIPSSARSSAPTNLSEINVTPLVDVMLVLLIVFMVSAPMMQQGVQVKLPKAKAQSLDSSSEPVFIAIKHNQEIFFNKKSISRANLGIKLKSIAQAKPDVQVYVQADEGVAYGVVAKIMAEIKQAKITRLGLVTEAP